MAFLMILLPLALALGAAALPSNRLRPWLIPLAAILETGLGLLALAIPGLDTSPTPWLLLDLPGKLILLGVLALCLPASFYAVGYLRRRQERSNRAFTACLIGFLGIASLVAWARHLGLLWVAMEGSTLVIAPLIYFNNNRRSLEATWKFLLVGSVGIALALLGTFFLAYASLVGQGSAVLSLDDLVRYGPALSKPWLRAAFILLLVGYGTKMGLAPMHTWKPDAYGEAPGVVGAVLSGGVTSCAFLALLRVYTILASAGEAAFASRLLVALGLISMAVAGLFLLGQRDFKRMLAYSSVEHMGILAFGLGLGPLALFGTLLHVLTNGLTKGVLFLSAGNLHRAFGSKDSGQVRGALRLLPLSGGFFLLGFLAITGSPPFGPFTSLFAILGGAFAAGRSWLAGLFLALLLVAFIGMGKTVLAVVQGGPSGGGPGAGYRDDLLTVAPIAVLAALVLLLGLWIPRPLQDLIEGAMAAIGAGR